MGSHNRPAVASRLVAPLPSPKTLRGGRKEQGHPGSGRQSEGWWQPVSWPLGLPTPRSPAGPRPPEGHRGLFRASSKPKRKGWPGVCSEPPGLCEAWKIRGHREGGQTRRCEREEAFPWGSRSPLLHPAPTSSCSCGGRGVADLGGARVE